MNRDVSQLTRTEYDLLVIGGGIHGACIAWDAALRGLSVALVEKGDFGHATSANSLKIIHGGLRYLQDADWGLIRTMIRERRAFARIAPHLVHPLPCIMPTSTKPMRSKPAMAVALLLNDIVSFDRNHLPDPQKRLPRGRTISRGECLRRLPGMAGAANGHITGGAVWYDYQIYNSERLTLAFILSAADVGADVANYVEAVRFLRAGSRITGITACDRRTGLEMDIRARVIVNAAGAWVNQVLGLCDDHPLAPPIRLSTAMNLVTRQVISGHAAGIPSIQRIKQADGTISKHARLLFVVPWRNYSIIGTDHASFAGHPSDFHVNDEQINTFLTEFNIAYPGADLTRDDVHFVHSGFLPAKENGAPHDVALVRQGRLYDHWQRDGIAGLITVAGVKYTTAREMAEQTVDMAFDKLSRDDPGCTTETTQLRGGEIDRFSEFISRPMSHSQPGIQPATVLHLIYTYGSMYPQVLRYVAADDCYGERLSESTDVIRAEVIHGIREEMAQTLADIVFRRTELGSAGHPGEPALHACAETMAAELGWDRRTTQSEIDAVEAIFAANS